jgi:hypothetical protein
MKIAGNEKFYESLSALIHIINLAKNVAAHPKDLKKRPVLDHRLSDCQTLTKGIKLFIEKLYT